MRDYTQYEELPLVRDMAQFLAKNAFENTYVLACQHILPSVHLMLRSMIKLGLKSENTALIGKCYSTSNLAMQNMMKEGIYVCPSSSKFDSYRSFDEQFIENINLFVESQLRRMQIPTDAKLIIIDDGGELITVVNHKLEGYRHIFGVEQTTAGSNKLKKENLNFPVVNIARSFVKLRVESPMIAQSITKELLRNIDQLNIPVNKCLIIGNGSIGSKLKKTLQNKFDVTMYDIKDYKSNISFHNLVLATYDLIIGTTGTTSINYHQHSLLKKGAILASASSSDREFDVVYLRQLVDTTTNCHEIIKAKDLYLLNSGFPLNFKGSDYDSVEMEKIQLVIALMFMGVYQLLISKVTKKGLVRLKPSYQQAILDKFLEINLSPMHMVYKAKEELV
ncbi:Rossmann-fold NAD(P)-binding domain-containing protein [Rickettsiales endosymbiont of Stachyamoeba lipophora]|uniref:hypothetical protein n=1 Tax=Rickettsiales endosymbiont of Stachyamoeba lipophora TaxID=2486578 RepID=UPI000F653318|nr:hypothetical protein [Rickettsiales endosymbiont of Stachyamoeba lipophora]AZL16104.1 hypothetical protein EF513_06110 [Rickettsiales endosymbiont of Stachyamoeba lipophora]